LQKELKNMYESLSQIQKKKFFEISGIEYDGGQLKGEFPTPYPYNNKEMEIVSLEIFICI